MEDQLKTALLYSKNNKEQFLQAYKELLRIPSISTDPEHAGDVKKAAEWIVEQLISLKMKNVQVFQTKKHPFVFGEWLGRKNTPTVLIYGHFDVQPTDPTELWQSDPFSPSIRGEDIFARGASDMKGQVLVALKAVESLLAGGELPLNIKWFFEGEEEIGSPSMIDFLTSHKDLLKSDLALNPDSGMLGKDYPTLTYALRGLAYFELKVFGPAHDLHSGVYGGVVHNPANALAELLAGMHDSNGMITLPGFYDKVRKLSLEEKNEMAHLPTNDAHFLKETGAPALFGEAGYTANERVGARPTLDVNGLLSGFTGPGSKTVIPAWAMAKISMRLVPDQDPVEVHQQLIKYLEEHAPDDIRWELIPMAGGPASISSRDTKGIQAMTTALESVWGTHPYFRREGGSIPVVRDMQKILGMESVICGFGLPDDNVHAPNEKMHLPTFYKGIDAIIHFLMNMSN